MGKCSAFDCQNNRRNGIRLFRFPRDEERRRKWKAICQRTDWEPSFNSVLCERKFKRYRKDTVNVIRDVKTIFLMHSLSSFNHGCIEHFDQSQYELRRADGWIKLKPNAIPIIPSISSINHLFFREKILDDSESKNLTEDTVPKCIILNCSSTYFNCSLSFFEVPSTYFRQTWSKVIRNSLRTEDALLNDSSVVCSKHFLPEDFIHSLKKKYLKGSAVPSIHSDDSNILTDIHERNPAVLNVTENVRIAESIAEVGNDKEKQRDIICRICAQSDETLTPIYGDECLTHDIPSKILAYLPTPLAKDDHLSQLICHQCVAALISWHTIYQRAADVSHMMQTMLHDTENDPHIEVEKNIANIIIPNGNEEKENDSDFMNIEENDDVFETVETELTASDPEPVKTPFQCDTCGKLFRRKHHLKKHMSSHEKITREETIGCDVCDKLFKTKRHMKAHRIIHEFLKRLKCNLCDKPFERREFLEQHFRTEHSSSENNAHLSSPKNLLPCTYCSRTFTTRYWLNIHISTYHKNGLLYVCEVCDQEFRTEDESKTHIEAENHKIDAVKLKKCSVCELEFESRLRCRRHQAEVHDIGFACKLCPLVLETPEELLQHSTPHPRRKYFECEYCQKKFTSSSDFRRHLRIHTGEPIHSCDICGKKFIHKTKMTAHTKLHYIDRKYICSICGAGFLTTKDARKHRTIHTVKH